MSRFTVNKKAQIKGDVDEESCARSLCFGKQCRLHHSSPGWMQSPRSVIMTPESTRESPPVKRQLFLLTAALNSSWDLTPSTTEAMWVQGSEALQKQSEDAVDGKRVTRRRFAGVLALLACITIVALVSRPHDSLLPIDSSPFAHQTPAARIDSNKKRDEASDATMQQRRKMAKMDQKIREEKARLKAESEPAEEAQPQLPSGSITRRSKPMAAVAKATRVAVPLMASVTVLCQALLPTLILVPSSQSVLVPLVAAALTRAATVGLGVRVITHGKLGTVWHTLASTPLLTPQLFIANVVTTWSRQQFKSTTKWIEQRPHALRRWIDRQASRLVPVVVRHHV